MPSAGSRVRERLRRDPRIQETEMQKARWFVFEMETEADLQGALGWLSEAFEVAGRTSGKST